MKDESPEPTDEEMEAWLRTPEGIVAMREVMEKSVAGEYGELPEEVLRLAQEGLKKHHSVDVMQEVKRRIAAVQERVEEVVQDGPERSIWAFAKELDEEVKTLMDLVLEVHEPRRTVMMRELLGLQQELEPLMKRR